MFSEGKGSQPKPTETRKTIMALQFTPVVPTKTAVPTGVQFDEEFVNDFSDALNYLIQNKDHHLMVEFPSAAERDTWFLKAKSFGERRQDGVVHVRRIKGSDSMNKDHGKLTFTMELGDDRDKRRMAAAEYKADLEARRAAGETIRKGRQPKVS
jgi:hypothetical protein